MVSDNNTLTNLKKAVIAQEISLVKILCDNNQSVRHRGLSKVERWLTSRAQGVVKLDENDFKRLWKGLFYCLWMADKPLYQEEVAEVISKIVHCFSDIEDAIRFIKSFFIIFGQEWIGIDNLRMDKCMMLVRRVVRQSFILLSEDWDQDLVNKLANCYRILLYRIPDGLIYHLCDVYINELSKVSDGKISDAVLLGLVKPFAEFMSTSNNSPLIGQIASTVFLNLIRLTDLGVEYQSRFKAWRDRGLPAGTIEVIKKEDSNGVNDSDPEDNDCDSVGDGNDNHPIQNGDVGDKVFDPRAGRVDVELATFNYDAKKFIDMFKMLKLRSSTTTKARKQIDFLIKKFSVLSEQKYPLGLQRYELPEKLNWKNFIRNSAKELIKWEENNYNVNENDSFDSSSSSKENGIQQFGVWQVTPIKREKNNKTESLKPIHSSKSVLSTWTVIDKRKDTNQCSNIKNEIDLRIKCLKRKLNSSVDSDNDNCTSKSDSDISKKKMFNSNVKNQSEKINCIDRDETEVIIKKPKRNNKRGLKAGIQKENSVWSDNSTFCLEEELTQPVTPAAATTTATPTVTSSAKRKRVAFLLTKNTVQEEKEYQRMIKAQPVVQFDGEKRPVQPIYKDKGVKSPINPFYKALGFTSL